MKNQLPVLTTEEKSAIAVTLLRDFLEKSDLTNTPQNRAASIREARRLGIPPNNLLAFAHEVLGRPENPLFEAFTDDELKAD